MTPTIEATGLHKRYGSVTALDGFDLIVERGQVVGLLGPNGAGKTTALRILVGLVRADAGSVWIAGEPVDHLLDLRREAPPFVDEDHGAGRG